MVAGQVARRLRYSEHTTTHLGRSKYVRLGRGAVVVQIGRRLTPGESLVPLGLVADRCLVDSCSVAPTFVRDRYGPREWLDVGTVNRRTCDRYSDYPDSTFRNLPLVISFQCATRCSRHK